MALQVARITSDVLPGGGDTIVAVATAAGRAAIAMVRVSGPEAFPIIEAVTRDSIPPERRATLRAVYASDGGDQIDQCVLTVFPAPRSYTGEDVAELSVHGGLAVVALVIEELIRLGGREAQPGEFTRRAVLNGKLDLLQAEAVADLIDSRSRGGVRSAMRQLDGGLTRRILALRAAILEVEALVSYDIDFPEEDDGPVDRARVFDACEEAVAQLRVLLATVRSGELVRDGALVVIAGAPNAGKSSLFNALIGQQRALVTSIAGTTRDAIETVVDADPWTLRLVDTAGLRDATEVVERLGIEVAERYLTRADIVLVCGDDGASLSGSIQRVRALTGARLIAVQTKADLVTSGYNMPQHIVAKSDKIAGLQPLPVSSISGLGIAELLKHIKVVLAEGLGGADLDAPVLMRARHERAVREAAVEMESFLVALKAGDPPMIIAATHLRAAAAALESMIGVIGVDDILDRVFSSFCIGK